MIGLFAAALAVAAPLCVQAQSQSAYGQCGGSGWSGPTLCTSGYSCSAENAYYAQCVPSSTTSSDGIVPPPTTTLATSTISGSSSSTQESPLPANPSVASTTTTPPKPSISSGLQTNPFAGYQIYANPNYASEISTSAIPAMTGAAAEQAAEVGKVGTFFWLDVAAKVPIAGTYMADIEVLNSAGANPPIMAAFVVYDLPDRDCAAAASSGEYTVQDNGVANYKAYIDSIVAQIKLHPTVNTALVIEPDSLGNLVTNLNVAECAAAQDAYKECVTYAIQQLNLPNVAMYLDAGHAGWLGWPANIGPAAQLFGQLYTAAGSPSQVRGLATNVANYNAWAVASPPSYTQGDPNYDEQLYVNALAPLLVQQGYPAHFITDTARNGVQPTKQQAWGKWCNVIGAGFGVRPTTDTGDALEDAFVWIKPGGECDGTSNSSAPRYDYHCGSQDALQPAPEAGTWFQAYFAQLVENANPPFS